MKIYQAIAELQELVRQGYARADLVGGLNSVLRTQGNNYKKLADIGIPWIEEKKVTIQLTFKEDYESP